MISTLKPTEISIPKEDPFVNDKLDRKKCADALTNLIKNTPGPLVASINGEWGTGKTVFLKMWSQSLANEGFTTIYFSAWEDDYCDDALIALIGQIWKNLKDSDSKEMVKSVKECAAPVLKSAVFNAARTVSAGIIDFDDKKLSSISQKAVDEYLAAGEKLSDLKQRLKELAQKLSQDNKPLVIVIDELDRCRPTFAIELLEKVKHLFDVTGIYFVLGIDREQLGHSIKCVYGQDMDVDGYLRRFIDMEFILPEASPEVFCSHTFDQFGLNEYFKKRLEASRGHLDDKRSLTDIFAKLCFCFKLSLRDIEHCCRLFVVAYMNTEDNHFIFPPLFAPLVILKLVNSKLYHHYVTGNCKSEEIIEYILEQPRGETFLDSKQGRWIEAHLFAASPKTWRDIALHQMQLLMEKKEMLQPEYLPDRIKDMEKGKFEDLYKACSSIVNRFECEISSATLGYLSNKIELASLMLGYRE